MDKEKRLIRSTRSLRQLLLPAHAVASQNGYGKENYMSSHRVQLLGGSLISDRFCVIEAI